jgi:hypothetical protein
MYCAHRQILSKQALRLNQLLLKLQCPEALNRKIGAYWLVYDLLVVVVVGQTATSEKHAAAVLEGGNNRTPAAILAKNGLKDSCTMVFNCMGSRRLPGTMESVFYPWY